MEKQRCSRCKEAKPVEDFGKDARKKSGLQSICRTCDNALHQLRYPKEREAIIRRVQAYYARTRRDVLKERTKQGLCQFCDDPCVPGQTRCLPHLEKAKAAQSVRTKRFWMKLKADCFAAYGKQCVCCGETNIKFLTLDHIHGGGKRDRAAATKAGYVSVSQLLRRQGFQKGNIQTMCFNCNCGRAYNNGICPHKQQSAPV